MMVLFQNGYFCSVLVHADICIHSVRKGRQLLPKFLQLPVAGSRPFSPGFLGQSQLACVLSFTSCENKEHGWKLMDFTWDAAMLCMWTQELGSREKCRNLGVISDVEVVWKFLTRNSFEQLLVHVRGSLFRGFCCFGGHTLSLLPGDVQRINSYCYHINSYCYQ